METFKKVIKVLNIIQFTLFACIIIVGIAVITNTDYFIHEYAQYIVVQKNPEVSDAIVVISGATENDLRIEEGFELMNKGFGKDIIFSGYSGDYLLNMIDDIAGQYNVDKESIIIEGKSQSTYENAENTKEIIDSLGDESLVVVSSLAQSKRALIAYQYVFGDEYSITVSYSEDHLYDPDAIFSNKAIREEFTNEAIKFVYYFIKYGI